MKLIIVMYGSYEIEGILGIFNRPILALLSALKHLQKEKEYYKQYGFSFQYHNPKTNHSFSPLHRLYKKYSFNSYQLNIGAD